MARTRSKSALKLAAEAGLVDLKVAVTLFSLVLSANSTKMNAFVAD